MKIIHRFARKFSTSFLYFLYMSKAIFLKLFQQQFRLLIKIIFLHFLQKFLNPHFLFLYQII